MDYTIVRSNRKTLALIVKGGGEVVVRAPFGVSEQYIASFVTKHESWIARQRGRSAREKADLSDGARLTLFGSDYTIGTGRTRIAAGRVYLPAEGREAALTRLLRKYALEVMTVLTARIAARYGFAYRSVRISSARGRWGSCNRDGMIAYSFRIAFLPPALSEYVAVHELSHTVELNHSPAFWRVVESVMPDWKARRKALKDSGAMNFL